MNNNAEHSEDFNQYISFYDLEMNEPDWQEAWKSQDKDRVEALLYKWGCDINYGWEIKVCAHRPRLSKPIEYGPRFQFKERVDKQWQKTGMSFEDQIANTKDSFLKADLMVMSQQSNFSGDLIDKYGEEGDEVVC